MKKVGEIPDNVILAQRLRHNDVVRRSPLAIFANEKGDPPTSRVRDYHPPAVNVDLEYLVKLLA